LRAFAAREYRNNEPEEKLDLPLNLGAMIGTGSTRVAVKGFTDSPFSFQELTAAQGKIREAMEAGAFGASMGIMYLPECYGSPQEFAGLVSPVKEQHGFAAGHIRGEGDSMVQSAAELLEIGRRAECRLSSAISNRWGSTTGGGRSTAPSSSSSRPVLRARM
jgi:N-acyl-D-aspartate/D-glutamate deacylase